LIYAVNQLSGKYRLGSIVASFFVLLDPVVRWIVLQAYWMYYVSPVSWSSIEDSGDGTAIKSEHYYSCKCDNLYRLIHHSRYRNETKGYYRIAGTRKKIVSCKKRKTKIGGNGND